MDTTAGKLREARESADLTIEEATVIVRRRLGRTKLSSETVRRFETGTKSPLDDPVLVAALFDLYDRNTADEDPAVAERLGEIIDLLERHSRRRPPSAGGDVPAPPNAPRRRPRPAPRAA
jgi:hypothetical protein